jgi:hypothetical protein
MAKTETFVIFETTIAGELARVEVPADPKALTSRQTRLACETIARVSFRKLSPRFVATQPIKAVDIITVPALDQ